MTNAEQARQEINSFTRQLEQIAHSGVATFDKLMAAADKTPGATASAAEVALMAVLEKFGLAAAEIGREWYLARRAAADLELAEYTGALFEGYSTDEISEMVQKVVAQSAEKDEGLVKLRSRLKNLADERIVDSARRSIRISGTKTLTARDLPAYLAAIENVVSASCWRRRALSTGPLILPAPRSASIRIAGAWSSHHGVTAP